MIEVTVTLENHEDGYCSGAELEKKQLHPYYVLISDEDYEQLKNEPLYSIQFYIGVKWNENYNCGIGSGYCGSDLYEEVVK